MAISELVLFFDGGLQQIRLFNDPSVKAVATASDASLDLFHIELGEALGDDHQFKDSLSKSQDLHGIADLVFEPKATKVLSFQLLPREAGDVHATRLALGISESLFTAEISVAVREPSAPVLWWEAEHPGLLKRQLDLSRHSCVDIRPKPPKLCISLLDSPTSFYTDEMVDLTVLLVNEESEAVDVNLSASLIGLGEETANLRWHMEAVVESPAVTGFPVSPTNAPQSYHIGELQPREIRHEHLLMQAPSRMTECTLEIRAHYALKSDPKTMVNSAALETLLFIGPFEASCDFMPRVNEQPWPNYFAMLSADDLNENTPNHRTQKWSLAIKLAPYGDQSLLIERAVLRLIDAQYNVTCKLHQAEGFNSSDFILQPNELTDQVYGLDVQDTSLEERHTAVISFELDVYWRRSNKTAAISGRSPNHGVPLSPSPSRDVSLSRSPATKTTHLIPSLSMPFGEPRVLASSWPSPFHIRTVVHLTYMLENPSMHILTFRLTMEASDDFAFSGPKSTTTTLVPLSRVTFKYNLLPASKGRWIRPLLKVVDVGFGKSLSVMPAEGCQADRKGLMVWIGADRSTNLDLG